MPRTPRAKSASGIYHVVMRGVGRQLIFEDNGDRQMLLEKLGKLSDGRLRRLRDAGISIRQAERLTGIGRKPVSTAYAAEKGRG